MPTLGHEFSVPVTVLGEPLGKEELSAPALLFPPASLTICAREHVARPHRAWYSKCCLANIAVQAWQSASHEAGNRGRTAPPTSHRSGDQREPSGKPHTAVNDDRLARHITGIRRGQERNDPGNVLWGLETAERDLLDHTGQG